MATFSVSVSAFSAPPEPVLQLRGAEEHDCDFRGHAERATGHLHVTSLGHLVVVHPGGEPLPDAALLATHLHTGAADEAEGLSAGPNALSDRCARTSAADGAP